MKSRERLIRPAAKPDGSTPYVRSGSLEAYGTSTSAPEPKPLASKTPGVASSKQDSLIGASGANAPDSKVMSVPKANPPILKSDKAPAAGTGAVAPKVAPKPVEKVDESAKKEAVAESAGAKVIPSPKPMEETRIYLTKEAGRAGILPNAGYPNAAKAVDEMYRDIMNGMNTRHVSHLYDQWRRYCASVLARSNRNYTGNELNGRCRLAWYDQLYRNPIPTVKIMEQFTREMYCELAGSAYSVICGLRNGRDKMGVAPATEAIHVPVARTPDEAVAILVETVERASALQKKSVAGLNSEEMQFVAAQSQNVFCTQMQKGHTLGNISWAQFIVDIIEKMDKAALYDSAEALLTLTDDAFLAQLEKMNLSKLEAVDHHGQTLYRIPTKAGDILVGDTADTNWELDTVGEVVAFIDLGGNDTYSEGVCNMNRPTLLVLDLGKGNDTYTGTRAGIQGGSIMGVSLWYNQGGDNTYKARDIAQGSTIAGAGILIDNGGNDKYVAFQRGQGSALGGIGLIIDRAGTDDYRAAMHAQGLGHPAGFAALVDKSGDDHYFLGGYYTDSYPEHPGYDAWGQGLGAGIRQVACGGIGLFLEGDGDDTYEFDYFGHGGGYWMGIGAARDFGGNDNYAAITHDSYLGGPRMEGFWSRFSNGFGCHYALGYCFDDFGNDVYGGTIMGSGMGWDLGAGFLVDFDGNDEFNATQGLTQGVGAEGSIGVLMEYRGDNIYRGNGQGYAGSKLTYHSQQNCGANFSFLVDHGGKDVYGGYAQNNTMNQSGMATGFVIDRPTTQELAEMEKERQEALAKAKADAEKDGTQTVARPIGNAQEQQQQQQQQAEYQRQMQAYAAYQQQLQQQYTPQQSQGNQQSQPGGGFGGGWGRRGR